jgi:hypothetical protein
VYSTPLTLLDSINFCLPLKDCFSNTATTNTYHFLKAFDEPNLSLKGGEESIFRLMLGGFGWKPLIITLIQDRIIVKIADKGLIWPDDNYSQLSDLEALHYRILETNLHFSSVRITKNEQQLFDSMTRMNPMLNDFAYYNRLYEKMISKDPFRYKTIVRIISTEEYQTIIDSINASGYWKMTNVNHMPEVATDGAGFVLEAHLRERYQFVQQDVGCYGTGKFTRLCTYLLKVARLDNTYKLE